ncbi:LysR family transcriptional regulator [Kordiimonas sp. SCSIO 12610]|uniref:LysR family transcriptional regulator n=1 Tax=Kordiimonas sp. SCSIO 12610 TaxID=2829597 RepID=UPI00210E54AA|nr:LysR family transcriptional regulator [Kordiimonas sp. SCSIO 12610]
MIDLYLLRYFIAVVETGNFTRAAERAFVTQPTLSAGIKKLESQIGQPLFERTNRRVFLTDAGTRFLPRAKAIMHECNLAMQAIEGSEDKPVLRLGLLITLAHRRVGEFLLEYKKFEPDITIEVFDGTEQELLNRLDERSIDYALSLKRSDNLEEAIPLRRENYVFILPKEHTLNGRSELSASDLREENMIVRSRCEVLSETSRYFTDSNIRPRLVYRTANDARAVAMVAAGLGGTLVPESFVDDRVTAFDLTGFNNSRELALLRPRYQLADKSQEVAARLERFTTEFWGN